MSSMRQPFNIESLEIIENFLYLLAKKEREISDLYIKLEDLENRLDMHSEALDPVKVRVFNLRRRFTTLIADPVAATRMRLKEILSRDAGCMVVGEAATGADLIKSYEKYKPSFVVSEIELPTIDEGYEALMEIKEKYPRATIIVLSSHVDDIILLRVMEIGAFDFMLKPINHMRLVSNVDRIRKKA